MTEADPEPSRLNRCKAFLLRPSARYSLLGILVVGFFSGIIFWGGFNTAMEATNTLEFCTGCHVPKDWTHKMIRKANASFELWGKITGSIDTPEKFEARRMVLATHEWERMKGNDSRECRNCHSFEAMSAEKQKQTPYKKHMKAKADGQTCIDCHKGIAHHLPKEYKDPDEE